jgi:Flp pilus assembly protein TadB
LAFILGFVLVAVAVVNGLPWLAYLVIVALFIGVFLFHRRLIRLRTQADMAERVLRFTKHFGVSLDQLVQAGLRDGGDFKMAAQFLRSCF